MHSLLQVERIVLSLYTSNVVSLVYLYAAIFLPFFTPFFFLVSFCLKQLPLAVYLSCAYTEILWPQASMAMSASSSEAQLEEQQNAMKYILVSGGVISGVGKGVITSSLGTLLKSMGLNVTAIKIDPYLNIDAGTFSPYEHGKLSL